MRNFLKYWMRRWNLAVVIEVPGISVIQYLKAIEWKGEAPYYGKKRTE
jgi:hypothetical protein